jgi:hypothetical protein
MDVEFVIPFAGNDPHRLRALDWLCMHCQYPYAVATLSPGPWIKGLATWPAVKCSEADIIVIHDADVWTEGLDEAIQAVVDGAAWAQPHAMVHRLSESGTDAVLDGDRWEDQELVQSPYRASVRCGAGGIMVAKREVLLDIPIDIRFVGWGQEDVSHDLALTTLVGQPWRGKADLVHLWHPSSPRLSRRVGSPAGWDLFCRYHEARLDPADMLALVSEAHAALQSAISGRDHHSPLGV